MSNWFKSLFCGSKCKCHGENKECCGGKKECCENTPKVENTPEVKPVVESSTPEVKM